MKFKIRISSKQKTIDKINNGLRWNKKFAWFPTFCDHHLGDFRSLVWLSNYYERLALKSEDYCGDHESAKSKLTQYNVRPGAYSNPGSAWRLSETEYTALTIENSPLINYYSQYALFDSRSTWKLYRNNCPKNDQIKFEDEGRY